jgi:hypothetical protein
MNNPTQLLFHTSDPFTAVTDITDVPAIATVGMPLTLTGTVVPSTANNQTIVWSIKTDGGTGSLLTAGVLTAANTGTVTVTATIINGASPSTNFTKDFPITVKDDCLVTTSPFVEGFEGGDFPPYCWQNLHVSGAGTWTRNSSTTSGYYVRGEASAMRTDVSGGAEDYLVSPPIKIPMYGTYILEFWSTFTYGNYYNPPTNKSEVMISNTSNAVIDFTPVFMIPREDAQISGEWTKYTISLHEYRGEDIYIAFHYQAGNDHRWFVDDVKVLDLSTSINGELTAILTTISGA